MYHYVSKSLSAAHYREVRAVQFRQRLTFITGPPSVAEKDRNESAI